MQNVLKTARHRAGTEVVRNTLSTPTVLMMLFIIALGVYYLGELPEMFYVSCGTILSAIFILYLIGFNDTTTVRHELEKMSLREQKRHEIAISVLRGLSNQTNPEERLRLALEQSDSRRCLLEIQEILETL